MNAMTDEKQCNNEIVSYVNNGIEFVIYNADGTYEQDHERLNEQTFEMTAKEFDAIEEETEEEYDLESHTLIIREGPDNKSYACLHCKLDYDSLEEFTKAHIKTEKSQEAITHILKEEYLIDEPQWEVIPDIPFTPDINADIQEFLIVDETQQPSIATQQQKHSPDVNVSNVLDTLMQVDRTSSDVKDEEKYCCMQCGIIFDDLPTAEWHNCLPAKDEDVFLKPAPPPQGKGIKCHVCGRLFANTHAINSHMRMHKAETPAPKEFVCEICNSSFQVQRSLE